MAEATLSKRDQLIQAALKLFNAHGFHAVGVDWVIRETGISKKTLYNHFPSKDDLIVAVLENYYRDFVASFEQSIDQLPDDPESKMLGVYDIAEGWYQQKGFRGCLYVSASGEFPDDQGSLRNICQCFKNYLRDEFFKYAGRAGFVDPEFLANSCLLLLEGSMSLAQIHQNSKSALDAKAAAVALLQYSPKT